VKVALRAIAGFGRSSIDALDERLTRAVGDRFFPWLWGESLTRARAAIHLADLRALATERRDLMPSGGPAWPCLEGVEPFEGHIYPVTTWQAETTFLERYRRLQVGTTFLERYRRLQVGRGFGFGDAPAGEWMPPGDETSC
jgi:hypothetical protein